VAAHAVAKAGATRDGARTESVAGVRITHPDRVFSGLGIRKLDLARYYEAVGARMLPHVMGRPLSLRLWSAREEAGVFMRHARAWGPSVLRRVKLQEKTKVGEYLVVDDEAGLVALAQMDVLEIHTWNSLAEDVEHPDRVIFDLDPAADVPWPTVVEAARDVRERLEAIGLASWCKTTGGKGLHLAVPLTAGTATWPSSFAFARGFAQALARSQPGRYVATAGESRRAGRIFVDYLRNNRTSTSVAAFSIRPRPEAPVSTPIDWRELDEVTNADFTLRSVLARLRGLGARRDPWKGYWACKQALPSS
jgi:bifunctional non-homologous end joining protein LigD